MSDMDKMPRSLREIREQRERALNGAWNGLMRRLHLDERLRKALRDPLREAWETLNPSTYRDRRRAHWKRYSEQIVSDYKHYLHAFQRMPRKGRIRRRDRPGLQGAVVWLHDAPHENALKMTAHRYGMGTHALKKHLRGKLAILS